MVMTTPIDHAPTASLESPDPQEGAWVTGQGTRLAELFGRLMGFPRLVVQHRDLVNTSVKRDLEARFQGTLLGWAWPLFHPLFLFAVYYFIFTKLLQFKIPDLPEGQESAMGIFMFCGIVAWAAFAEAILRGSNVIVENGNLIKKLAFPSEVLPLNITLVGLVTLFFAVVVFALGAWLTPVWVAPGPQLLWVPVILLLQGVFTYGLVLLLSTLQVFLRDVVQVMQVLVTVWMFATPLFWVPELMPPGIESYMGAIRANPMFHLIQAWRGALMGNLDIPERWVDAETKLPPVRAVSVDAIGEHLLVFSAWAAGAFLLGYAVFIMCQRKFADEV